ncbi:MAG TPA: amidohydrolase family protein [Terriglobia bacterium]|nr:amidohydrolase family protein [Terriglobia bacterium]
MNEPAFVETPVEPKPARRLGSCRLVGARVAVNADSADRAEVEISNGLITAIKTARSRTWNGSSIRHTRASPTIDLSGYLLLPGLINAHDHLEFNLFPRLGRGPYLNFQEWANDVYHPLQSPVREHLLVPKPVRYWWGAIKNLLSGVTTVCHHNAAIPGALARSFPIRVVDRYGWAHSLALGKDIGKTFRSTLPACPFIIHLAEGTDKRSGEEIFRLDRLHALGANTVVVHGVGLTKAGHLLLAERGAGLIWCPTSNLFTLGRTLSRQEVAQHRQVALGSDSALTGQGDLLDEISFVRDQTCLNQKKIYSLVTDSPARVLRLGAGEGAIRLGGPADFLAVPDTDDRPGAKLSAMTTGDLEVVMVGGRPELLSAAAAGRWPRAVFDDFEFIRVGNIERWVHAPLQSLLENTRCHLGEEIFLAGKKVTG